MKILLTTLCALILSSQVYAASGRVNATVKAGNSVSTYTSNGSQYVIAGVTGQAVVTAKGSGILSELNSSEIQDLSSELPNTAQGEYNVVTFTQLGDTKAMMVMDSVVSTGDQLLRNTVSAEVELLSGKWSDIETGATLQFKATRDGEKQIEASKKQLAENLKVVLTNQLSNQGFEITDVSVKVKASKGETMSISKTSLIVPSHSMEAVIKISVRL